MMKGLDAVEERDDEVEEEEEDEGTSDAELVTMMGFAALDAGGLDVIKKGLESSQNPAQVVGQFLAQTLLQMAEFTQKSLKIDPGVYMADGGFLEQMLDYIERKLGLPPEFSDEVYGEAMETIKAVANSKGPNAPKGQAAAPAQASAPQGQPAGLDMGGA